MVTKNLRKEPCFVVMEMPALPGQNERLERLKDIFENASQDYNVNNVRQDKLITKFSDAEGYGEAYLSCMVAEFSDLSSAVSFQSVVLSGLIQAQEHDVAMHYMDRDTAYEKIKGCLHPQV